MTAPPRGERSEQRPIRIGVQLAPQHAPWQMIRDAVLRAEDLGVDVVFGWDHFFPLSGDPDGAHFEAWTQLAAIAEVTERIEFGPLVTCNSYRAPDLHADMARTVDHISARDGGAGRLIFGIGSGWAERDYEEYGYAFGTVGSRLDDLTRDVPRIRRRWALLNPPPTRSIPILVGGQGERKTLRVVAEHADIWHSFAELDAWPRKLEILRRHCEVVGRDPGEIELSTGTTVRGFGPLQDEANLEPLYDLGVRLFVPAVDGPDHDLAPVRRLLAWRDSRG